MYKRQELSKEEIITLYLNTVNFGYGSYGVQAASQAYFSKDVQDLKLSECAALAALPQMPTTYQLIEYVGNDDVSEKDENILKRTSNGTYLANDASKERREDVYKRQALNSTNCSSTNLACNIQLTYLAFLSCLVYLPYLIHIK